MSGARARVGRDLLGAGSNGAAGQQLGFRLAAADTDRQLRRANATASALGEEALGAAVLERVESDRGEAAAERQHRPGARQRVVERVELTVDGDPDSLEAALGRVAAA